MDPVKRAANFHLQAHTADLDKVGGGADFSQAQLILVGTVHGDPRGYRLALSLLEHLQPELVTVEISPFSVRYRRRHEPGWQRLLGRALEDLPPGAAQHPAIQRVAAQVSLPFEVRAARDWCRQVGTTWHPLDLGAPARRHLPRYSRELLSPANLQALLASPDGSWEDLVAAEYGRARLAYQRPPWRLSLKSDPETLRREGYLARRLKRWALRSRRVVHLGGWEHFIPWRDGTGLWTELADLKPRRVLLVQVEALLGGGRSHPFPGDSSAGFF